MVDRSVQIIFGISQLNAQRQLQLETIEAHNRQVNSALDIETGNFVFKVLMKSFEFEKSLMQEHFNENFMWKESDKFPNATFKGKGEL
jgi:hypothetical protein